MGCKLHFDSFVFKHDKPCFMYLKKLEVRKVPCQFDSRCKRSNRSRQKKCIKSAVVGSIQCLCLCLAFKNPLSSLFIRSIETAWLFFLPLTRQNIR